MLGSLRIPGQTAKSTKLSSLPPFLFREFYNIVLFFHGLTHL